MSNFEQFGKYILLEKLASGGMAEVYLAKSTGANGVNKFLAIKRILPQFNENPEFIDMFKEEAKICVNLNNSNVVSIFDFGIERGQFYLVMEYVEGRNLRQIINELKKNSIQFSVEQICFMVKEVAAGLDHAHRCIDGSTGRPLNITHRDMSPQNIMVSFDGETKIIDFGIAKAETQLEATKAGTLKGKFGYMSPEQADGQTVDPRTDVFSLGIVLWELLANDRLFTASSEAAILRKIRDAQIPSIRKINPNVPPELEKIVNKALAKDRNLRYQTAAAMHKDLNKFLNLAFPDFNPQDFAVFIKNTFTQAYQDSRRKLVDYAKIQSAEDKTQVVGGSPPPAPKRSESTLVDHSVPAEGDDQLPIDASTNIKVDLQGLRRGDPVPAGTKWNVPNPPGAPRGVSSHTQTQTRTGMTPVHSKTGVRPMAQPVPLEPMNDEWVNWGLRGALASLVAVTVWYASSSGLIEEFFKGKKHGEIASQKDPKAAGTAESASKQSFQVTINSQPQYAEIWLGSEGQEPVKLNEFTPKVKTLEAYKKYYLVLKKEGYLDTRMTFTLQQDATSLNPILQRLGDAAFITITTPFGGEHVVVSIDGQPVSDRLPLGTEAGSPGHPIPAGRPVRIRAVNTYTGAFAEDSVMLQANQKKDLVLILTAPQK